MVNYKLKPNELTLVALTTAITCILGPLAFALPFSPIPFTLGLLGVFLSTFLLGPRLGTISCFIYLLVGTIGLPVFSGFTGGIAVPLGPSGGYLLGYLFIPICCFPFKNFRTFPFLKLLPGALLGLFLCYFCGTLWLSYQLGIYITQAFLIGTLPYIPFDIIKLFVAYFLSKSTRMRLSKAGLIIH